MSLVFRSLAKGFVRESRANVAHRRCRVVQQDWTQLPSPPSGTDQPFFFDAQTFFFRSVTKREHVGNAGNADDFT